MAPLVTLAAKWKAQGSGFRASLRTAFCLTVSFAPHREPEGSVVSGTRSGSVSQCVVEMGVKPCGSVYPMWPPWTVRGREQDPWTACLFRSSMSPARSLPVPPAVQLRSFPSLHLTCQLSPSWFVWFFQPAPASPLPLASVHLPPSHCLPLPQCEHMTP